MREAGRLSPRSHPSIPHRARRTCGTRVLELDLARGAQRWGVGDRAGTDGAACYAGEMTTKRPSNDGGLDGSVGQLGDVGGDRLVRELEHNFAQRGMAAIVGIGLDAGQPSSEDPCASEIGWNGKMSGYAVATNSITWSGSSICRNSGT